MSLTPDEANLVRRLRTRIVENRQAGRPLTAGLDEDELTQAIRAVRGGRMSTLGSSSPKSRTSSKKPDPRSEEEKAEAARKIENLSKDADDFLGE